jgi:hypothetical protein
MSQALGGGALLMGAGEGEEEGMRREQKHNGGGLMVNFPLYIFLSFPLHAWLHINVQATCKMLKHLKKLHLCHQAQGQNNQIVLKAINNHGSVAKHTE